MVSTSMSHFRVYGVMLLVCRCVCVCVCVCAGSFAFLLYTFKYDFILYVGFTWYMF